MPIYTSAHKNRIPTLTLVEYPNDNLLKPSIPVDLNNIHHREFLKELDVLYFYLRKKIGQSVVGIAAPQAGLNIRAFIVLGDLYINPKIIWIPKNGTTTEYEGCLSLPINKMWEVIRPYSLTIEWSDLDGNLHEKKFNGINARAIFHELDHLNGILCCGDGIDKEGDAITKDILDDGFISHYIK